MAEINAIIKRINDLKRQYYNLIQEFQLNNIAYIRKHYDFKLNRFKNVEYYYPLYINLFFMFLKRIENMNNSLKHRFYETIEIDVWRKMNRALNMFIARINKGNFGNDKTEKKDFINYAGVFLNEVITEKINEDNLIKKPINLTYNKIDEKNNFVIEYVESILRNDEIFISNNYLASSDFDDIKRRLLKVYSYYNKEQQIGDFVKFLRGNVVNNGKYRRLRLKYWKSWYKNRNQKFLDNIILNEINKYKHGNIREIKQLLKKDKEKILRYKKVNFDINRYIEYSLLELEEILIKIYSYLFVEFLNRRGKITDEQVYKIINKQIRKHKFEYLIYIPKLTQLNLFVSIFTKQMLVDWIWERRKKIIKNINIIIEKNKNIGINIKDILIKISDGIVIESMNAIKNNNKDNNSNEYENAFDSKGNLGRDFDTFINNNEEVNDIIKEIVLKIKNDKELKKYDIEEKVLYCLSNGVSLTTLGKYFPQYKREKYINKIINYAKEVYIN